MKTITQAPAVIHKLLTERADEQARETGFVRRKRVMTGSVFVQVLVFGWLQYAQATQRQLHQVLLSTGTPISCQGLNARFSAAAVAFLRAMVVEASQHVFSAKDNLLPALQRFNGVYLTDGSRLERASGGFKVVVRLDLQRGGLQVGLETLASQVSIVFVKGQPGHAGCRVVPRLSAEPVTDQRGLSKAGRSRNQREFAFKPFIQACHERWTLNGSRPGSRDVQLRGKDWRRHGLSIGTRPDERHRARFVHMFVCAVYRPNWNGVGISQWQCATKCCAYGWIPRVAWHRIPDRQHPRPVWRFVPTELGSGVQTRNATEEH